MIAKMFIVADLVFLTCADCTIIENANSGCVGYIFRFRYFNSKYLFFPYLRFTKLQLLSF